jgi:hypothetical protein
MRRRRPQLGPLACTRRNNEIGFTDSMNQNQFHGGQIHAIHSLGHDFEVKLAWRANVTGQRLRIVSVVAGRAKGHAREPETARSSCWAGSRCPANAPARRRDNRPTAHRGALGVVERLRPAIRRDRHSRYFELIQAFNMRNGVRVLLINTPFTRTSESDTRNGEAVETSTRTKMDARSHQA